MKKTLLAALLIFAGTQAFANPEFTDVTEKEFEDISKEMSANFTHNSMLGASKMGEVFGFQFGVTAAQTATPKTDKIVKRNAGSELPNLYNMGLIAAVGVPFGLAAELVIFPEMSLSGAKLSTTSMALKYNINDVIPILPINLALRGIYSTSKFSFDQEISSVPASVSNKNSVTGLQLLISPMLPLVEPYLGIGLLNGSNDLSVTGTGTIFDNTFTASQSASKSVTTTQILAGVDVNLVFMKLGAEYSQAFGTNRFGVKLAFGF